MPKIPNGTTLKNHSHSRLRLTIHKRMQPEAISDFMYILINRTRWESPPTPRYVLEPRFSGNKTRWLTIHSIDPDGCSKFWFPLHRDFMVASPKSPTLTVRSSWRKMSDTESRTMNTSPERSPSKPLKGSSHDRPGKTKMAVSFLSVAMNALHSAN